MTITIYGIKTCDTTNKARQWLDRHGVAHAFHDHRVDGVDRKNLEAWGKAVGWEKLFNRASTTFRELPETDKENIDARKALALMLQHPTLIKRPLLDLGDGRLLAGFKPAIYKETVRPKPMGRGE